MIGVSSLAALVAQAKYRGTVIAALDARMSEVYWGGYQFFDQIPEIIGELQLTAPSDLILDKLGEAVDLSNLKLVGNAWSEYSDLIGGSLLTKERYDENCALPNALGVLSVAKILFGRGEIIQPIDFYPEYVRNNVAVKGTKKLI